MKLFAKEDLEILQEWFISRNLVAPELSHLPQIGLIEEGVAAGFLIQAECKIGFLEFYISNPRASKEERETALYNITKALSERAKAVGITRLMFNTKFPTLKVLADRFGFQYLGEYSSFTGEV